MFLEWPVHCSPARGGQRGGQRHHSQKYSYKDEKEAQAVAAQPCNQVFIPLVLVVHSVAFFLHLCTFFLSDTVLVLGKMRLP